MKLSKYYLLLILTFVVSLVVGIGSYFIAYNLSRNSILEFSRENALNYIETGAALYGSKRKIEELENILEKAPYILKVKVEKGAPKSAFQVEKTLIFPDGKVHVLITLNRSLIEGKALLLATKIAFLTLLLTGLTLLFYLFAVNKLYFKPLKEIVRDVNSVSEGSLKELPLFGSDEFGRIRESINRMIRSIKERDEKAELMSSFVSLLTVEEGIGENFTFLMKKLLRFTGFDGVLVGIKEKGGFVLVKCITRYEEREFLKNSDDLDNIEEYLLEVGKEVEVKKKGSLLKGKLKYEYAYGVPLISFSQVKGYCLFFKKRNSGLKEEDKLFIRSIARSIATAVEIGSLIKELKGRLKEEAEFLKLVLRNFVRGLEIREPYSEGHSERVAYYCKRIAQEMGLTQEEIENAYLGGLLHDVGKVGIPDNILAKPSKLTEREYDLVEFHPLLGYELFKDVGISEEVLKCIKYHHERWDGKGYPEGLKDNGIPLLARIVAVAEAFETMMRKKIYGSVKSKEEAVKELLELSGKAYDPLIVKTAADVFLKEEPPQPEDPLSSWVIDEVKERFFDYLFRDPLTGVFNKNALDLAFKVAKDRLRELSCAVIKVHNLEEEKTFIVKFVNFLVKEFPDSVLVKYSNSLFLLFLPPYRLKELVNSLRGLEAEIRVKIEVEVFDNLESLESLKEKLKTLSNSDSLSFL